MVVGEPFTTGVRDNSGVWAAPPEWMSYSSLREVEECPRRWALRRSSYSRIWDRSGYPDLPALPTLVGDVVHLSLERILRALVEHGCDSPRSARAVEVLRECGGYTSIVGSAVQTTLAGLVTNPRARGRLSNYRSELNLRLPELRRRVQEIVSRSTLFPRSADIKGVDGGRPAGKLSDGSHTEIEIRADAMRWLGRVDLLSLTPTTCEIVDYKTGKVQEGHAEQLRTYALLWSRDTSLNPTARPATRLVVAYPTHDVTVDVPTEAQLDELDADLQLRTQAAREEIQRRPPHARPAPEVCSNCSVRQLCPEYWQYLASHAGAAPGGSAEPVFGDAELRINSRQGPKSWDVAVVRGSSGSTSTSARLRSSDDSADLSSGSRIRLLNVLIQRDEESQLLLLTMSASTEIFHLVAS